jgi:hypothetical protein
MTLRVVVVLLAVAFVAYRLRPSWRLPWSVPLILVGVVLTVRTVTWVAGE